MVQMKFRMTLPLIFLLMTSGVFGENWNVIYETKSICALKGSSVNMSCTYTYPQEHKLTDTFWIKELNVEKSLKDYDEYKDRVEYIENRHNKTAVLRLHNITKNDERAYCFRLITATDIEKWFGKPGIQLHVSGLQVQAPPLVLEKETLNLTCRSTCNLTDRFIWYKNGQALNFTRDILQFQSDRSDSGRYSCAVRGHEHLPSPAVNISVEYPPQSVSVLISGSGVIVEGDSVTLNCSSDSNPPALNFSWFKEDETSAVGSGQSFSISSFNSSFSGRFYCEAQNKYGSQRSASVSLFTVKDGWSIGYIIGLCVSTATVALFCLFLIIIIESRRKKMRKNDHRDSDNHLNDAQDIEQKKTSAGKASESGGEDMVLYASVKRHRNKDTKKAEEDEIQYASITVHRPATEAKSTADQEQDLSVIYSDIK